MQRRSRRRILVAAVALVVGPACLAQWDPDHVVHFDIERKRVTEALPFDVPFYLLAPTPAGFSTESESRAVLVQGERADLDCEALARSGPDPAAFCRAFPSDVACKLPSAIVQAKPKDGGTAVQQIEISVPPLAPKKDYCLGVLFLRQPKEGEPEALLVAAAATLRGFLDRLERPVLTHDALDSLCTDVQAAMERTLEGELTLVPAEGSTLAHCGVRGALFGQGVLEAAGENLETALEEAVAPLRMVKASIGNEPQGALQTVIAGLEGNAQMRSFLLGASGDVEPLLLTPEQIAEREEAIRRRWEDVPSSSELGVTCPPVATAPPGHRLACFREIQVENILDELESLRTSPEMPDREEMVGSLAERLATGHDVTLTTWDGFRGRAKWYFTADVGVAHAWQIDETFDYTGANIYLAPVNKQAPLNAFGWRQTWTRRFAFMVGLPNGKVDIPGTKPLFGSTPLLLGAGLRLTDHIRFAAGAVVFEEEEPDPLVDATRGEAISPFASLSVDIDIVSIVKGLFNGNGTGNDG